VADALQIGLAEASMTQSLKRVLIATDGSIGASEALDWLTRMPLSPATEIEVVTALPRPFPSEILIAEAWKHLWTESEAVVDAARSRLAQRWTDVTGRVVEGDAREAIVAAALTSKADLVVLGARGLGSVASALLGSVSLGVARHAPCPVLVCKGAPRALRTVTVGIDGSAHARAAVEFLCAVELPPTLTLRLLGVVEPLPYPRTAPGFIASTLKAAMEDLENEARGRLQGALDQAAMVLRPRVGRIVSATPVGGPAATLVRDADVYGSDLIVVGARGLGTLERLVLGSVSEGVLRHARCPVLVVRPRD
jgi:nucleotide-binding universal stress UspA family protein